MSDNRRHAPRRDAFRVGSLHAEGLRAESLRAESLADALECLVWDVSETGAQVEVAADAIVPDRFTLAITAYEPPRDCVVVRRDGRRLGVRFDG
ncbi:PilZ domain-containing protein [uncultured Methylobacterium sp.]|uniref:PilZ domain-containing protein n=1 Tax=uncultured Methylobacterium sp. TaxID=157278 RepID=UPI0035CAF9E1